MIIILKKFWKKYIVLVNKNILNMLSEKFRKKKRAGLGALFFLFTYLFGSFEEKVTFIDNLTSY